MSKRIEEKDKDKLIERIDFIRNYKYLGNLRSSIKFKEVSSFYKNISFCSYVSNLLQLINSYSSVNVPLYNKNGVISVQGKYSLLLKDGYSEESMREIFNTYNSDFISLNADCIDIFFECLKYGVIDKIINFKINKKHYINYNFYTDNFYKHVSVNTEDNIERTITAIDCSIYFFLFGLMLIALSIADKDFINNNRNDFLQNFNNIFSLSILTGYSAVTEIETGIPYTAIFEELSLLKPDNEYELAVSTNPERKIVQYRIKSFNIFERRYEYEGYNNKYPLNIMTKHHSIYRITQGKTPTSIRLYFKRATGKSTLGVILKCKQNIKIHLNELYDSNVCSVRNMLCFSFMAIISRLSIEQLQLTDYLKINDSLKNYKGKRNIVPRFIVLSLLTYKPQLEPVIIKQYFKHKVQREEFLRDLKKLKKQINSPPISALLLFLRGLVNFYVW